ncbi:pilus assembly protein PilM [Vibrio albus]|uniref:Pilus assembly protein PilM n=1 Tax=Vibrio albus TaxID=2200953 RepID=A0A2U3B8J4_9VIBR|nr:type IV pilus assembly protein PilM [Vibrio albus]PWI33120.1 pilus assembly protein PilM [Vibrio albus]
MSRFLVTGIDVGHHSLKAVVVKSAGKHCSVVAYKDVPFSDAIFSDNQSINHQKLVKKLKELKKSLPMFSSHVAISLPDNAVISKVLNIDSELEEREKEFAIYQAFAHQSPIPIEELSLDFVDITEQDSERGAGHTYQVYATRKDVVEERLSVMKKAGFKPVLVDMQAHSLQKVWSLASEQREVAENWMLVDIGLTQTSLCVAPPDSRPFFRDIVFGTSNMEGALEGDLTSGDVKKFFSELNERLQKQIQMYNSVNPMRKLEGLWICGGGATIEGLCIGLGRLINLKCELLNPLELIGAPSTPQSDQLQMNIFGCATGLAVQGVEWMGESHAT